MPIGQMTQTRNVCKYHARSPRGYKRFAVITLSRRKGLKATIASKGRRPYSKSSKIINVMADKRAGYFKNCSEALPTLRRIGHRKKVM